MFRLDSSPLRRPLVVNSPFGPRWGRHHGGIDLDANYGDELVAVCDGVVRQGWDRFGGGNWSTLDTGTGTYFGYGHAAAFAGDGRTRRVRAGETIAYAGSTGDSTGPHLHFAWHPSSVDMLMLGALGIRYVDPYADPLRLLEPFMHNPPAPPAPTTGDDDMLSPEDRAEIGAMIEAAKTEVLAGVLSTDVNMAAVVHHSVGQLGTALGTALGVEVPPLPPFTVNIHGA